MRYLKNYFQIPYPATFVSFRLRMLIAAFSLLFMAGCGEAKQEKAAEEQEVQLAEDPNASKPDDGVGIGAVKTVDISKLDATFAENGKSIFNSKCSACHQLSEERIIGPGLAGVTKRRKPEWIMNMVINPEEMTRKDPTAKALLKEYGTQMVNQNITEEDARAVLEFLRQNDGEK